MTDATHLAKLLEGVVAWNAWREADPGITPHLRTVDLTEHALRRTTPYEPDENAHSKVNLEFANLQGAELWGANLQGADLKSANLQGADLESANLQGAKLSGTNLQGAELWGANLQGADLRCANLQGADLGQADLRSADLRDADVTSVHFDRSSRQLAYQGIRVSSCYGSQHFKTFAQDQDYVEELRRSGKWGEVKFWLWWLFADCGRSFIRWGIWSLGLALLFGTIYYGMGTAHIKPDPPLPFSLITMVYYSVVTFTTLGFGDVKPQTEIAAMIVMFEVIIGYVMLGGLVSILANKLARRA